jgi:hypothetical protein
LSVSGQGEAKGGTIDLKGGCLSFSGAQDFGLPERF